MRSFYLIIISFCLISLSCKPERAATLQKEASSVTDGTPIKAVQTKTLDIDISKLNELMLHNKDLVLLDVRTPAEFHAGHIDGATHIDFYSDSFQEEVGKLTRDNTYLVYCKSGGRSSKSGKIMEQLGFKSIYNLIGGYTAYAASQNK